MSHSDTLKACAYSLGVDIDHLALVLPMLRQMKADKESKEWNEDDSINRTIGINFNSITLTCSTPHKQPLWQTKN